jgi:hypothetical protein
MPNWPGPKKQKASRSSTAATTPRPPARHALEDLFDQDPVVGSGGFELRDFESDSDGIDYFAPYKLFLTKSLN